MTINKKEIFYHMLYWAMHLFMGNLLPYLSSAGQVEFSVIRTIQFNVPEILAFYLGIFVCRLYANPLDLKKLIPAVVAVYALHYLSSYLLIYQISALGIETADHYTFHAADHGIVTLWKFFKYCGLGMGYYFIFLGIQNKKKIRLLEREKQDAEYAFLRSQVNPNLLNGTLNYLHQETRTIAKDLADDLAILCDIMRYSLQSDKNDRLVLLSQEITHINNIIKINQLRFNNRLEMNFNISGEVGEVKIIPLILITIVENILKHGICTSAAHLVQINLTIDNKSGHLYFNTWNQNRRGPKEHSSGIGLENIKKRLVNHYQNLYSLVIEETENDYQLNLSVPFAADIQRSRLNPAEGISAINRTLYPSATV